MKEGATAAGAVFGSSPPPESAPIEEWRSHPRLLRHVRRFEASDRGNVLSRYVRKSPQKPRDDLLRDICHIGAWVALLPPCEATRLEGEHSALSVFTLLLKYLGSGLLTPWFLGILCLVDDRLKEALASNLKPHEKTAWKDLRAVLRMAPAQGSLKRHATSMPEPRKRRRVCSQQHEPQLSERFQRRHDAFLASTEEEQLFLLSRLEEKALSAFQNWDAMRAARLVQKAASCLEAPRPLPNECELVRSKGDHQTRLRKLILKCLKVLDLSDENTRARTQEACQHISFLMDTFLQKHDSLENAHCQSQWLRLRKLLDTTYFGEPQKGHCDCQKSCSSQAQTHKQQGQTRCLLSRNGLDSKGSDPRHANLEDRKTIYQSAELAVLAIQKQDHVKPGTEVDFLSTRRDFVYTFRYSIQQPSHWYCNCPAWKYQKLHPRIRVCKHMDGLVPHNDFISGMQLQGRGVESYNDFTGKLLRKKAA